MNEQPKLLHEHDAAFFVLEAWRRGLEQAGERPLALSIGSGDHKRDYIGLSSAGACGRQTGFQGLGYPATPLTLDTHHAFHDGHLLEADTAGILSLAGITVDKVGMEVSPGLEGVLGHIDGIITHFLGGRMLLEHKTMRVYPWKRIIGESRRTDFPENVLEDHPGGYELRPGTLEREQRHQWLQIQTYLYSLHQSKNHRDVLVAVYFARSRESNKVAVEVIPYDSEAAREEVDRLGVIAALVREVRVPGADYDPTSKDWQCRYCRYREACIEVGNSEGGEL